VFGEVGIIAKHFVAVENIAESIECLAWELWLAKVKHGLGCEQLLFDLDGAIGHLNKIGY
jgi:hypothetical protein